MSMKELLSGDCGQHNPVLRVASHFAGSGASGSASLDPVHLVGRSSNHGAVNRHDMPHGGEEVLLPPTTFRMDSLLKEIRSLDPSQGPTQAPRVVDLTQNTEWVQEFQSNDHHKWADEFSTHCNPSNLDLDRVWESQLSGPIPQTFHHPHAVNHVPVLEDAQDLLDDTKWADTFDQTSKTELMSTAEEFIQSINDPTIKATEFMSFVEKLSTGEVTQTSSSVDQWVSEFESAPASKWAEQFKSQPSIDSENMTAPEREEFWSQLQREWEVAASESSLHPWLNEEPPRFEQPYQFQQTNPYSDSSNPLEEGKKRLAVSDIPSAALYFEAAVQQDSNNVEAWYLLGTTQALNEQDPQAISALSKCTELEPGNLKALMALAASLTNESYNLQACRTLKAWLKQNPEYSDLVPENLQSTPISSSMLSGSELSNVQNLYMKAARKRPAQNLDPDVQCGLGVLFNLSSDFSKAADCFRAAVNADPSNALLWNRLGATLANGGESAESIGAYSKALEILPGFIRTRYNLGIACVHLGSYREAAEHFLTALNMQASSRKVAASISSDGASNPAMSDSIWTSLRMVIHLLDRGKLSASIDKRDLSTLNREFGLNFVT